MNLRQLARLRSMTPRLALLTALLLTPTVASAQRGGGGGHTGGGVNSGVGHNGYHQGQGNYPMHHGYDLEYLGGVGYGWGVAGSNPMGMVGMSPMDQDMIRQAYFMESYNRAQLQQTQAMQAYEQAKLASRQSMMLAGRPPVEVIPTSSTPETPTLGLGHLVLLDKVLWPVTTRGLVERQREAEKALIEVHKQAVTNGYAEGTVVSVAKDKLRLLNDSARKSLNKQGKDKLARFVQELDLALDRSLRRPNLENAGGQNNQQNPRVVANR